MYFWLSLGAVALGSYLAGSVPFGFLAGKAHGIDIRRHGSGNIGATNVFRVLGKGWGILVFVADLAKGLVPVLATVALVPGAAPFPAILAAIAAILGHNYTCWLGFSGGKGIATSAGALLGLMPVVMLGGLAAWILVFAISRYVSLASICAAVVLPLIAGVQGAVHPTGSHALTVFAAAIATLAVWRHRSNIQRLLNGTEHRFSKKPTS